MFGLWGKKRANADAGSANAKGPPIIAALLVEGAAYDTAALGPALAGANLGGRTPRDVALDGNILTCTLADEIVAVAPMPAPYPWSDLEGPCQTSWMWPEHTPAESVRRATSHVIVTAIGGASDPIRRRLPFTQFVALAARHQGVIGVYWPEATLVHYPPFFAEMAQETADPGAPPLILWVDFRVFKNPDGTSGVFTTGLRPLGQMEFEIPRIAMPPGELRAWAADIATYVLQNGHRIKDGDTIGTSATHRLKIRHRPSKFGHEGTVLQIQC